MEQFENQIILRGDLLGMPEFSHENHGKRFCRFLLEVERLSGAVDTLPVVAREELLKALDLSPGIRLTARLLKAGKLVICRDCADAIREFGLYRWEEPGDGQDRVKKEHDHAMDDIRYFAMGVMGMEN